jgi:mitogen-activated protein kinase kinase
MAKTNIGCQTYMAPERIAVNQELESYSVSSDVWSLGLTLWEAAAGMHPFLNSKYDSLFAQLNAIVNEVVPELPTDRFSAECRDFVNQW